jgi:hypothetical protein
MSTPVHRPLARWAWASGLMSCQAMWSFALHQWIGALLFTGLAIVLIVVYRLEQSYGRE